MPQRRGRGENGEAVWLSGAEHFQKNVILSAEEPPTRVWRLALIDGWRASAPSVPLWVVEAPATASTRDALHRRAQAALRLHLDAGAGGGVWRVGFHEINASLDCRTMKIKPIFRLASFCQQSACGALLFEKSVGQSNPQPIK